MNILLVGINAKFIHTNLAVAALSRYAWEQYGIAVSTAEYTINQTEEFILSEIYRAKPDFLGFSCYIWNYSLVCRLVPALKAVLPGVKILLGGPEVSFDAPAALKETGGDFVLSGEGEEAFSQLCLALERGEGLDKVPALTWMDEGRLRQNPPGPPLDLAKLPFPYPDLSLYENRILYYEAQRGCPFNCQYCLSSREKGVRFQPLEKVKAELRRFLDAGVRQVKFVDRTFNANPGFAMEIWRYLADHDNGVTNFHFELESDLLTEEQLDFLSSVRKGLFQFEIGVQSTNPETLAAVDRKTSWEKLVYVTERLRAGRNIHLHLDLIAGLPLEDYESFGKSFDDVYRLQPDQLQLGFLKLLKGSGLRRDAEKYSILYRQQPPYEVLSTNALPFGKLLLLKDVEEQTERYYNSGHFRAGLSYLISLVKSPFAFYQGLGAWSREQGLHQRPLSEAEMYGVLYQYGCILPGCSREALGWLLCFDLYAHGKARSFPDWLPSPEDKDAKALRRAFFSSPAFREAWLPEYGGMEGKQLERSAHLLFLPGCCGRYLIGEGLAAGGPLPLEAPDGLCACLFNYRRKSLSGNGEATVFFQGQWEQFFPEHATDPPFPDTIKMNWCNRKGSFPIAEVK